MSRSLLDFTNSPPWSILMFDTGLSCISSCLGKNITVSSDECLIYGQNFHIFLGFYHIANSTYVNPLIDFSFRK